MSIAAPGWWPGAPPRHRYASRRLGARVVSPVTAKPHPAGRAPCVTLSARSVPSLAGGAGRLPTSAPPTRSGCGPHQYGRSDPVSDTTGRKAAYLGDVSARVRQAIDEDPETVRASLGIGPGSGVIPAADEVSVDPTGHTVATGVTVQAVVAQLDAAVVARPDAAEAAAIAEAATDATAKANAAQAAAIQRSAHTGTQATSTVTGLDAALAAKADLVAGKVPTSQIPAVAVNDTFSVADQAEMLALDAALGDLAWRTDFDPPHVFQLLTLPASTLGNWVERTIGGGIESVNGQSTAAVVLAAADVGAVPTSRTLTAGAGLTGGGDLSANRSVAVSFGTTAGTVAAGEAPAAAQAYAVQRDNHTGTQSADTVVDGSTNKVFSAAMLAKLNGIATAATANASDVFLRSRNNHTDTQAQATIVGLEARLAQMDADIAAASGGTSSLVVTVTADGVTDAAPTIQAALDALPSSGKAYKLIVLGSTKGTIHLNSKVRITTSNTEVSFANPVLIGTGIDPDGFGGLSITGSAGTTTTVSSGGTRGSSKVVVASTTGIAVKSLVKIYDTDTTGGQSAGNKAELAEVVDISGTTLYLDHPLHHTYSGTVTLAPINAITRSGFSGLNATFTGQQTAGFLFVAKMQYTRLCYFRDMHFRGDPSNSWSRECYSMRDSYRPLADNCTASFGWNYTVGSTYDYGFTADMSTGGILRSCRVSNTRHAFSADKGTAGFIYADCVSDNTTASGFDLHGGWVRDITYSHCVATASDGRNSGDNTKSGFLAGNTTFKAGAQWITYIGCVAQGFQAYTSTAGAAGAGESAGFGVVDGSENVAFLACRVSDSTFGLRILSQVGTPIKNITIQGCVFDGIAVGAGAAGGMAALPIYVNAGVAPNDVDGLFIRNNTFTNCAGMASARIYGNSGNTLANVIIEGNAWIGPGASGVFPLDIRYVDDPLIKNNTFYKTRRGVTLLSCTSAVVTRNTFVKLVDGATASNIVLDSGGANTNLLVVDNDITGFTPTAAGTAPSSSGAVVQLMPSARRYTTAGRPSAAVVGAGCHYYDTTLSLPVYSDGAVWKDAAGTTV